VLKLDSIPKVLADALKIKKNRFVINLEKKTCKKTMSRFLRQCGYTANDYDDIALHLAQTKIIAMHFWEAKKNNIEKLSIGIKKILYSTYSLPRETDKKK
jgi:hypothetical protein